jgi:hypothetical protein
MAEMEFRAMSTDHVSTPNPLPLDAELQRRIEAFARAVGVTPVEVIRKAFEEYEAAHDGPHPRRDSGETAFDVVSRAGLIGCILARSAEIPVDLATNPEHMHGFGRSRRG